MELLAGRVIADVTALKCCPIKTGSSKSTAVFEEVQRSRLFSLASEGELLPLPALAELG